MMTKEQVVEALKKLRLRKAELMLELTQVEINIAYLEGNK